MKARIKATGYVAEVSLSHIVYDGGKKIMWYNTIQGASFTGDELEFIDTEENFDYWTRLEHQAAISAMGGLCGNLGYDETPWDDMAEDAIKAAHALVQKLKEKEEK